MDMPQLVYSFILECSHLLGFVNKAAINSTCVFNFFFIYFLMGGELLYNVMLVSAVQQCKSGIIAHIFFPS